MRKTKLFAYITQHDGNRNDSIKRRVWEDAHHQRFVKLNGDWYELDWFYSRRYMYDVFMDIE